MDTAIRLFAKLHELPEYTNSLLYVIGKTGEGTKYLEEIVEEQGIADVVKFTGSIEEQEKIEYLKKAKHYFQLSKYEGFGVAALEALCAKCIVIHSGRGGLSNPIYENGIRIDVDKPIEEMFEELKSKLASFEAEKLEKGCLEVCNRYDNERRKEDFRRIIAE
jgi:glycosyltransferase involved in cell wall biosynthesis